LGNCPYKTGDIIKTVVPQIKAFDHYGILFYDQGMPLVASFCDTVSIDTYDCYVSTRTVRGIIPSDNKLSDNDIYQRVKSIADDNREFNVIGYNCESFVREVCGRDWGMEQKNKFLISVFIVVILIFGFFLILRH
jgi:hypothetical protein